MRFSVLIASFSTLLLAACSGGSAITTPAATAYSVTLGVIAASGATPSPVQPVVLYDEQFLDPTHASALVGASVTPIISQVPSITWTSSSAAVIAQQGEPGILGAPIPTAPPGAIYTTIGSKYGVATLQAQVGSPVNQAAGISVYHYPSLSFGCRFRYTPAFSFDPGSVANGPLSDFYDTIGSDQLGPLDPCSGTSLATAAGTPELWHVPYGGTFIANVTLANFASIAASAWQNSATTLTPGNGALVFKTKGGLIVKALLPIGPYEVSDASGIFPY